MQFVGRPDLLGGSPFDALTSAIVFEMTSPVPKPSMHELIIGGLYVPDNPQFANSGTCSNGQPVNIKVSNGVVVNRFMAAISAINGAVACGSQVHQATRRTGYYIDWLALMEVPYAAMTPDEKASLYLTPNVESSGPAYCIVCKGDPYADRFEELGWKKRIMLTLNCDPSYG